MFTFNNVDNSVYNILVTNTNHLALQKNKIEIISVPGRTTGDLIIKDNSKENLELKIECVIDASTNKNLIEVLKNIEKWLNTDTYKDLIFNDGTRFKAFYIHGLEEYTVITKDAIECKLTFTAYK